MSRVLVTGATGSLGSALTRSLIEQGSDVVVLREPSYDVGGLRGYEGRFQERIGDITDGAGLDRAMEGVDVVFHLAAVAAPLNRLRSAMVKVNVDGARQVAEAAVRAGVRRLVHTSTVAAVGYPPAGEVVDESFDFRRSVTTNSYMLTKRAGEQAVLEVGERCGLEVVVVNPAAVIAPYSHRRYGWAGMVDAVVRGRLLACPPGGFAVCAVDEFVAGQLAALRVGTPGTRYILATANLTYRELLGLVAGVVGGRAPRLDAPASLVRAAGRVAQLRAAWQRDPMRSPFLVPENAELAVRRFWYDPGRSRRELQLRPGDLRRSIEQVHDWLHAEAA